MEVLIKGFIGDFAVKSIEQEPESYQKSGGAGIGYAHKMILEDGEKKEYRCQICDDLENFNDFHAGALIKAQVKTFGRGVHTITLLEIIAQSSSRQAAAKQLAVKKMEEQPVQLYSSPDPYKVIALECAVRLANSIIPEANVSLEQKVVEIADYFENQYLRK